MTKHALNSGFFALLRRILLERTQLPDRRGEIGKQKYSALLLQTSQLPSSQPPIYSPFPYYLE